MYIPEDATVNQLVDINDTFCKALHEGKQNRAFFRVVSKAFDGVCHKGIFFKLQTLWISGSLFIWIDDYLDVGKQKVVLLGAVSG